MPDDNSTAGIPVISAYVHHCVAAELTKCGARRVLDIGGTGRLAGFTDADVTNANIIDGVDGCRLPFADSSFDASVSIATLEHVSDQRAFLDEAVRVGAGISIHWFPVGEEAVAADAFKQSIGWDHPASIPTWRFLKEQLEEIGRPHRFRALMTIPEHMILLSLVNERMREKQAVLFDYAFRNSEKVYGTLLTIGNHWESVRGGESGGLVAGCGRTGGTHRIDGGRRC